MKKPALVLFGCLTFAGFAAGTKIIFDTDMVEDYDDVGAIAALHALADEGQCEILAMATCTRDNQSVAAVEIFNRFYGRQQIPVGCAKEIGVVGVPDGKPERRGHQKYVRLAKEYSDWVVHQNSNDAPDANEVYRKALASAPDKSVVFCSVGFLTNMRRLLETKGDKYSPLDGRSLVAKKVKAWYAMACCAPNGREYNVYHDAESSKIAFEKWPTTIVISDFVLGRNTYCGRGVAERNYDFRNPVKDIFTRCLPSREAALSGKTWDKDVLGHTAWDEVTVLAAVFGPNRYFETERGVMTLDDKGNNKWTADAKGKFILLKQAVTRERGQYPYHALGAILDELVAREPKCRRTDEAIREFRRSKLEKTETGVKMNRDGKVLWNFEIDSPEGRPFFHPLTMPGGKMLTAVRPKDHVWHLGYWFSWKFINGVNYWEPADLIKNDELRIKNDEFKNKNDELKNKNGTQGEVQSEKCRVQNRPGTKPDGETRVTKKDVKIDGLDCVINLELTYGERKAKKPVLKEKRTITIDPPDSKGGYIITTRHEFTALEDVTLDRTPPHGDVTKGKWGGGYAGATLRLDDEAAKTFAMRGFAGGTSAAECTGKEKTFIDFYDPASGEGVTFTQLAAPATGKFYSWPDKRMVNPSPVYDAPITIKKGETLKLAYKLAVHGDKRVKGTLEKRPVEKIDVNFKPNLTVTTNLPPYASIRLADANATVAAVGVGDLDGDGAYDYVVKTPSGGTDPWDLVWKRATDTHKLEAYTSKGEFLWRIDLGWNIEMGIWYSPFVVADLDGDGKAEVIAKTAPMTPDYRDRDGRVTQGPEYLTVFDGLTGKVRAETPWIPRASPDHVRDYNHFNSRNQIAIAHLDGKTPCVIMERGTYDKMIVDAYCLKGDKLERVWRFNNEFMPRRFKGQGDHACLCDDVDGDGCDEVLIGSLTIDHDGTVLWCNGRGHSDAHYYGDIDPKRAGMELAFIYETPQKNGGGMLVADPVTGETIWALDVPTKHVHGCGICADIDPTLCGLEFYGQEVEQTGNSKTNTHPRSNNRWFFAADGTLVSAYTNCFNYGNGQRTAFWDADLQRELLRGGMQDHLSARVSPRIPGNLHLVADLFGDWREELVFSERGELRIYTTDIPAMDSREPLMRDPVYRSRIMMATSGYNQQPILTYVPSAVDPNVSLRFAANARELTIDVTAALDKPLKGVLEMTKMPEKWSVNLGKVAIDLPPGGVWSKTLKINRPPCPKGRFDATLTLTLDNMAQEAETKNQEPRTKLIVHQPLFM